MERKICKDDLPGIIDDTLLKSAILKERSLNEIGRLSIQDGVFLEEIEEIRLEFCKIIKIDHLWVMKKLKKLIMNNNYIEKIENIECLVNLTELDLSFNKISKIQNLNTLIHLKILTLFENYIEILENMDELKELTIFSIGNNNLKLWDNVIYLRKLPNLKCLNMAGNPCSQKENFRYYVALFLPNVEYYEYKRIESLEREVGFDIFQRELEFLIKQEQEELGEKLKKQKEETDALLHSNSFVEYLNTRRLFESMFSMDPDGQTFLLMDNDILEYYEIFERNIMKVCREIFQMGQQQYVLRQNEIDMYNKAVLNLSNEIQKEAIEEMRLYSDNKSNIYNIIRGLQLNVSADPITHDAYEEACDIVREKFDNLIYQIWKKLMKLESNMYDQMLELNEQFERTLTDLITNFIEMAQGMFAMMRDYETAYNDGCNESTQRFYATVVYAEEEAEKELSDLEKILQEEKEFYLQKGEEPPTNSANAMKLKKFLEADSNREKVLPKLKEIMKDRENISSALTTSRDIHLMVIDSREDKLVLRAKEWLENIVSNNTKNEILRNRNKILEIDRFLEIESKNFENLKDEIFIVLNNKKQSLNFNTKY